MRLQQVFSFFNENKVILVRTVAIGTEMTNKKIDWNIAAKSDFSHIEQNVWQLINFM